MRCVFGSVHAGDAANVIPSTGVLRGTLRTRDHDVWRHFPKLVEDALAALLGGTGVTWTTEHRRGVPPVVNDEDADGDRCRCGARSRSATAASSGPSSRSAATRSPGTSRRSPAPTPGSGSTTRRPRRPRLDLHASTFDVDERAIGDGTLVLALAALEALTDLG